MSRVWLGILSVLLLLSSVVSDSNNLLNHRAEATETGKLILIVKKRVINDNGQIKNPSDFTIQVNGNVESINGQPGNAEKSFPGSNAGTTVVLNAGTYSILENDPEYTTTFSPDCTGFLKVTDPIQTKTCIVTNDDKVPATGKLIVRKHVINDDGLSQSADSFTVLVDGNIVEINHYPFGRNQEKSFKGDEEGTEVLLLPGQYSIGEPANQAYSSSLSSECTGTITASETKICTITNNDKPVSERGNVGTLIVKKRVINDDGGSQSTQSFTLSIEGDVDSINGVTPNPQKSFYGSDGTTL